VVEVQVELDWSDVADDVLPRLFRAAGKQGMKYGRSTERRIKWQHNVADTRRVPARDVRHLLSQADNDAKSYCVDIAMASYWASVYGTTYHDDYTKSRSYNMIPGHK
jgi:hypothetical protein